MSEEKNEIASNCEHVDEVNGACYGKQNLYKVYGRDEYKGVCQYECRLKAECINASRENREAVNRELAKARVTLNGTDLADLRDFSLPKWRGVIGTVIETGDKRDYVSERFGVPAELRPVFFECLERLAGMYLHTPEIFDAVIRRIFLEQKQSDLARLRGITRQAVSAKMLKCYAGIVKDLMPELPRCLTDVTERTVYMLMYVDGCSLREASKRSGLNREKIRRVCQKIASKTGKSVTAAKKKNKKVGGIKLQAASSKKQEMRGIKNLSSGPNEAEKTRWCGREIDKMY